jgi:hypothetical protein
MTGPDTFLLFNDSEPVDFSELDYCTLSACMLVPGDSVQVRVGFLYGSEKVGHFLLASTFSMRRASLLSGRLMC